MSTEYICWVLAEDGIWPVVGLRLLPMFGGAKVTLADGREFTTNRANLLSPDDLDKRFDCHAWVLSKQEAN